LSLSKNPPGSESLATSPANGVVCRAGVLELVKNRTWRTIRSVRVTLDLQKSAGPVTRWSLPAEGCPDKVRTSTF
jgi:hypothetical protein